MGEYLAYKLCGDHAVGIRKSMEMRAESKISGLATSRHLQPAGACVQVLVIIVGWFLWYSTTEDTCSLWLREGTLAMVLFKLFAPLAVGVIVSLVFCCGIAAIGHDLLDEEDEESTDESS